MNFGPQWRTLKRFSQIKNGYQDAKKSWLRDRSKKESYKSFLTFRVATEMLEVWIFVRHFYELSKIQELLWSSILTEWCSYAIQFPLDKNSYKCTSDIKALEVERSLLQFNSLPISLFYTHPQNFWNS